MTEGSPPGAFVVGWSFIGLCIVAFSLQALWDAWDSPVAYVIVGVIVVFWVWLFCRAYRRMRARKRRLDISVPP